MRFQFKSAFLIISFLFTSYAIAVDSDGDGYDDSIDEFPADISEWLDSDGDGLGNNSDPDIDGDGIPNETDIDDDGDGVSDFPDAFPKDPTETTDTDGDGVGDNSDTDIDGDGYLNDVDEFPFSELEHLDTDGDGIGNNTDTDIDGDGIENEQDLDDDGDGVEDSIDSHVKDHTETVDTDSDGVGNNQDTDDDNDGVLDESDDFPLDATETLDSDGDGVGDNSDLFKFDSTETSDNDNDGIGDNADLDDDNDNTPDIDDACPFDSTEYLDTDLDGVCNNTDDDDDADGVLDVNDTFPLDISESVDTDNDGIGNNTDTDDDNDGVIDVDDLFPLDASESSDYDNDGVGDNSDIDADGDGFINAVDFAPIDSSLAISVQPKIHTAIISDVTQTTTINILNLRDESDQDMGDLVYANSQIGTILIIDKELVYTPPINYKGVDTIEYIISNSMNYSKSFIDLHVDTTVENESVFQSVPELHLANESDYIVPESPVAILDGVDLNVQAINLNSYIKPGSTSLYWVAFKNRAKVSTIKQNIIVPAKYKLSQTGPDSFEVTSNGVFDTSWPTTISVSTKSTNVNLTVEHDFREGPFKHSLDSVVDVLGDQITLKVNEELTGESTTSIIENKTNVIKSTSKVIQGGKSVTSVFNNGDPVILIVESLNLNAERLNIEWDLPISIIDMDTEQSFITFAPSDVENGLHKINYTLKDIYGEYPDINHTISFNVIDEVTLNNDDTDMDGTPNNIEGFFDVNKNGLPDYLDASINCSEIKSSFNNEVEIVKTANTACIKLGELASELNVLNLNNSIDLNSEDEILNKSGIYDLAFTLNQVGGVASMIVNLDSPATKNTTYYNINNLEVIDFESSYYDLIYSSKGMDGYCPDVQDLTWHIGINEGDWCVKVNVVDGGANDGDAQVNGDVLVTAVLAEVYNTETTPVLLEDKYIVQHNSATLLNVTENDNDPDGLYEYTMNGTDSNPNLTLNTVEVEYGNAQIVNNQVEFIPQTNLLNEVKGIYSVIDQDGNKAYSNFYVSIQDKVAPLANDDSVSVQQGKKVTFDPTSNDIDYNLKGITVTGVSETQFGKVTLDGNNITFFASPDFTGETTLEVSITDGEYVSKSIVYLTVEVQEKESIKVVSGLSFNPILALLVSLILIIRRKINLTKPILLIALVFSSVSINAADVNQAKYSRTLSYYMEVGVAKTEITNEISGITNIKDTGVGYSIGLNYQFADNWFVDFGYRSYGQRSFNMTENPGYYQYYDVELDNYPETATGVKLGLGFNADIIDSIGLEVQVGFLNYSIESKASYDTVTSELFDIYDEESGEVIDQELKDVTQNNTILRNSFRDTKPYSQIGITYNFNDVNKFKFNLIYQPLTNDDVIMLGLLWQRPLPQSIPNSINRTANKIKTALIKLF